MEDSDLKHGVHFIISIALNSSLYVTILLVYRQYSTSLSKDLLQLLILRFLSHLSHLLPTIMKVALSLSLYIYIYN
jgi:hypothetical protein